MRSRTILLVLTLSALLSLSLGNILFAASKPAAPKSPAVEKHMVKKAVKKATKKAIKKKVKKEVKPVVKPAPKPASTPIKPQAPVVAPVEAVQPQAKTVTVNIKDFAFSPASVTIKKGDTIQFVQVDSIPHTATSDNGVPGFASALLSAGQKFSFTFETPGTFGYHCEPHPSMKGTVTVTE